MVPKSSSVRAKTNGDKLRSSNFFIINSDITILFKPSEPVSKLMMIAKTPLARIAPKALFILFAGRCYVTSSIPVPVRMPANIMAQIINDRNPP